MSIVWPSSVAAQATEVETQSRAVSKVKRMNGVFMRESLPHRADFLRLDLVENADFVGLAEWVDGFAQIFLRELVDVIVGTGFGDFDHFAADLEIAIRVGGILQRDGNARIAADVSVFHATLGGVDANELAVEVDPYRSDLRAAVRHECAQIAESGLFEQVGVFFGNDGRHGWFSFANRCPVECTSI